MRKIEKKIEGSRDLRKRANKYFYNSIKLFGCIENVYPLIQGVQ